MPAEFGPSTQFLGMVLDIDDFATPKLEHAASAYDLLNKSMKNLADNAKKIDLSPAGFNVTGTVSDNIISKFTTSTKDIVMQHEQAYAKGIPKAFEEGLKDTKAPIIKETKNLADEMVDEFTDEFTDEMMDDIKGGGMGGVFNALKQGFGDVFDSLKTHWDKLVIAKAVIDAKQIEDSFISIVKEGAVEFGSFYDTVNQVQKDTRGELRLSREEMETIVGLAAQWGFTTRTGVTEDFAELTEVTKHMKSILGLAVEEAAQFTYFVADFSEIGYQGVLRLAGAIKAVAENTAASNQELMEFAKNVQIQVAHLAPMAREEATKLLIGLRGALGDVWGEELALTVSEAVGGLFTASASELQQLAAVTGTDINVLDLIERGDVRGLVLGIADISDKMREMDAATGIVSETMALGEDTFRSWAGASKQVGAALLKEGTGETVRKMVEITGNATEASLEKARATISRTFSDIWKRLQRSGEAIMGAIGLPILRGIEMILRPIAIFVSHISNLFLSLPSPIMTALSLAATFFTLILPVLGLISKMSIGLIGQFKSVFNAGMAVSKMIIRWLAPSLYAEATAVNASNIPWFKKAWLIGVKTVQSVWNFIKLTPKTIMWLFSERAAASKSILPWKTRIFVIGAQMLRATWDFIKSIPSTIAGLFTESKAVKTTTIPWYKRIFAIGTQAVVSIKKFIKSIPSIISGLLFEAKIVGLSIAGWFKRAFVVGVSAVKSSWMFIKTVPKMIVGLIAELSTVEASTVPWYKRIFVIGISAVKSSWSFIKTIPRMILGLFTESAAVEASILPWHKRIFAIGISSVKAVGSFLKTIPALIAGLFTTGAAVTSSNVPWYTQAWLIGVSATRAIWSFLKAIPALIVGLFTTGAAAGVSSVGFWALAAAELAALWPIGLIVLAIGALIAAFVFLPKVMKPVVDFFGNVFSSIWDGIKGLGSFLGNVVKGIVNVVGSIVDFVLKPIKWVIDTIASGIEWIANLFSGIGDFFKGIFEGIGGFFGGIFGGGKSEGGEVRYGRYVLGEEGPEWVVKTDTYKRYGKEFFEGLDRGEVIPPTATMAGAQPFVPQGDGAEVSGVPMISSSGPANVTVNVPAITPPPIPIQALAGVPIEGREELTDRESKLLAELIRVNENLNALRNDRMTIHQNEMQVAQRGVNSLKGGATIDDALYTVQA